LLAKALHGTTGNRITSAFIHGIRQTVRVFV
jgi:hypothetical protein